MNRRSFFSILIAPLLARFAPKKLPVSGIAIVRGLDDELMKHGMFNPRTDVYVIKKYGPLMADGRVSVTEYWKTDNPVLYFMPRQQPYPWV